jgi:hypothetical protein
MPTPPIIRPVVINANARVRSAADLAGKLLAKIKAGDRYPTTFEVAITLLKDCNHTLPPLAGKPSERVVN